MFTALAIFGGLLVAFASGAIFVEVKGAKKALSELPALNLSITEDDIDFEEETVDDVSFEEDPDDEETEDE